MQCVACDSDPTGSEYDYVILSYVFYKQNVKTTSTKAETTFNFDAPEKNILLELNKNALSLPTVFSESDFKNGFAFSDDGFVRYVHAVYYTDPDLLASLKNLSPCDCTKMGQQGFVNYYWDWQKKSNQYIYSDYLTNPKTQFFTISKQFFKNLNNNLDLKFINAPFELVEWQYNIDIKFGSCEFNYSIIRFKNKIPECVVSQGKLTTTVQNTPYYLYNNYYSGWSYYHEINFSEPKDLSLYYVGRLPRGGKEPGTPGNCASPFPPWTINPKIDYLAIWEDGYYYDDDSLNDTRSSWHWSKGEHTYFDLCSYDKDSHPICYGTLPSELNLTIITQCLGTQSANISSSTPVFYDDDETEPIPFTYTNCGNFKVIQKNGYTYYLIAGASFIDNYYGVPVKYQFPDLKERIDYKFRTCLPPENNGYGAYIIVSKIPKGTIPVESEFIPWEPERDTINVWSDRWYVYEYFIDDGDYISEPKNPVIPDSYINNGKIWPHSYLYQSWNVGDPISDYWYNFYGENEFISKEDRYYICERGNVQFSNKHDSIQYNNLPLKMRNEPIICNPFVAGPSYSNTNAGKGYYEIAVLVRFVIDPVYSQWGQVYPSTYKTYPYYGRFEDKVNGKVVRLKYRRYHLVWRKKAFALSCFSCPSDQQTDSFNPVTVTP